MLVLKLLFDILIIVMGVGILIGVFRTYVVSIISGFYDNLFNEITCALVWIAVSILLLEFSIPNTIHIIKQLISTS
jgi:hypothetical protein